MRPLEVSLVVSLAIGVSLLLFGYRSRGGWSWPSLLSYFAVSVVILQLVVEGYRWEMLPAYLAAVALVVNVWPFRLLTIRPIQFVAVGALCLLLSAIYFSIHSPARALPTPSGPFGVGTQTRHIVDVTRRDAGSDDAAFRELMIQLWYPTDPDVNGRLAPYRDRRTTNRGESHLALITTHSVVRAPLSKARERYPILLYAPSWNGVRTENTFHAEELASHGYIVVAMDHPHSSEVVVFPDGRTVKSKLVMGDPFSSDSALKQFLNVLDVEVQIRANDASFVVDALERWDANDPEALLTSHLALDRIGIFGFSLGGGVAAQACWRDRRFKAGIDLDGLLAAEAAKHGPRAPFLFLNGQPSPELGSVEHNHNSSEYREKELENRQYDLMRTFAQSANHFKQLDGMRHFNFADWHFYTPWPSTERDVTSRLFNRLTFWPSYGKAEKAARSINRQILSFFNAHLTA
jgi:dienelactone hydrolase